MSKTSLPEAYQHSWVPFIHTKIWLDSKPLIPRPETEYWVNEVIQKLKQAVGSRQYGIKILDLCAGSGAIGVAMAKEISSVQVDFVELDPKHHKTILKNVRENGVDENRVRIFGGDLFENIHDKYDLILTNPPYIDMSLGRVEESVLEHEPKLALDGGEAGLTIITRILTEAPKYLKDGGELWLEHEPEQVTKIKHLASVQHSVLNTFKDQYGVERYSEFHLA